MKPTRADAFLAAAMLTAGTLLSASATPVRSGEPVIAVDPSAGPATSHYRGRLAHLATGTMRKFRFADRLLPLADVTLLAADGQPLATSSLTGKIVLINVWATWCPPCREEMPQLDELQRRLGGPDFEVVIVSVDRPNVDVAAYLESIHAGTALKLLRDPGARSAGALGVVGMPTSILIDREGCVIGRLQGSADWSSDDATLLIKAVMLHRGGAEAR